MTATVLGETILKLVGLQDASVERPRLDPRVFGEKFGLTAALFGCWHENVSRPFGEGEKLYRSCLQCGARTPFNPETLETDGTFYYPPVNKL